MSDAVPVAQRALLTRIARGGELEDPARVPNLGEFTDPQLFYPAEEPFLVEVVLPIAELFEGVGMDEMSLVAAGATREGELARFGGIRDWMAHTGPWEALCAAPVIATVDEKLEVSYADGWHRALLAQRDFGLTEVPVVVVCPGATINRIWEIYDTEDAAPAP